MFTMNFELPEMSKKLSFGFSKINLPQLGLFHPYFVSKSCFRVISMIKMVILDQSRQIRLIFEKKNHNFKNPKFGHSTFIIHKNENKTSIQSIRKSNSTSFMFNKIFCEMKGKKVIHFGGIEGNGGTVPIASWKCNFGIYLDIQVYYFYNQATTTLLCLLLVLYVLVPPIYSFFYPYSRTPENLQFWRFELVLLPEFSTYNHLL